MSWKPELTIILRVMVNDLASETYADATLQQVLAVAAFQVSRELTFSYAYAADVVGVDITPDPSDAVAQTRDESFINLTCMKAACILDGGEARVAAQQGISVQDGRSAVDLKGIAQWRIKLLQVGWCKTYEDAKLAYQMGQVRVAGAAVMGPFRLYANSGAAYVQVPGRERDIFF